VDDDVYICLHKLLAELRHDRLPRARLLLGRTHLCFMDGRHVAAKSYYPDESLLMMTPDVVRHITTVCDRLSSRETWGPQDGYTRNVQVGRSNLWPWLVSLTDCTRANSSLLDVPGYVSQQSGKTMPLLNHGHVTIPLQACLLTTMQGFLPLNEPRYIYAGESIPADQQRFNFGEHRADMHNGLFATKDTTFTPWQLANVVPRWVAGDAGYAVCIPALHAYQRCMHTSAAQAL